MRRLGTIAALVELAAIALALASCAASNGRSEGLDVATLPADVRADYAVFARRCSKCHSLSRPLGSGITDDRDWVMYVTRMRRQPASGISENDVTVILRFLHYYSMELVQKKEKAGGPSSRANPEETRAW